MQNPGGYLSADTTAQFRGLLGKLAKERLGSKLERQGLGAALLFQRHFWHESPTKFNVRKRTNKRRRGSASLAVPGVVDHMQRAQMNEQKAPGISTLCCSRSCRGLASEKKPPQVGNRHRHTRRNGYRHSRHTCKDGRKTGSDLHPDMDVDMNRRKDADIDMVDVDIDKCTYICNDMNVYVYTIYT